MPLDLPALRARRDTFNFACPSGTSVCVRGADGRGVITTTRSASSILGSGEVVVWVSDRQGAVNIDRVTPLAASAGAA
jgi:hypothetical protein